MTRSRREEEIAHALGRIVEERMVEHDLSVPRLARLAKCSDKTIYKLLRGEGGRYTTTLDRVALALSWPAPALAQFKRGELTTDQLRALRVTGDLFLALRGAIGDLGDVAARLSVLVPELERRVSGAAPPDEAEG